MRAFINIARALADKTRVRILLALRRDELCVCQITEMLGLAASTVSKHLSVLYQAGLVESRKEGRWIYYRLPGRTAPAGVRQALDWVSRSLVRAPEIAADRRRLKKLLKMDPTTLCKHQSAK